ncbi:S1C family serine protease [Streptomyces sp. TR06-5]|uniref:S1C family serine protease n=1 Tax=unclassified Streptomyces TaxID=2593676 RepID=UPI0039A10D93
MNEGKPARSEPAGVRGAAAEPERADATEPAHRADPYRTPPYGGPGPWAPAPPVGAHAPGVGTPPLGTPMPGASLPTPAPLPVLRALPAVPPAPAAGRYDPWAARPAPAPSGSAAAARRRAAAVAVVLLVALVAGFAGGAVGVYAERHGTFSTVTLPAPPAGQGGPRSAGGVAAVARAVLPGVVTLHVSGSGGQSIGTGFVLDERGHILTNQHVIAPAGDAGEVQAVFRGGRTVEAHLVGGDSGYDLAVLRVQGVSGLRPLVLGDSDAVRVGDPVIAFGAPYDLAGTVTTGIVSAKNRPVVTGGAQGDAAYVDALQTDASVNPGNSGGPLVDAAGRVIGVNSALRSGDGDPFGFPDDSGGGSVGLGFAIPADQARRVAEELINDGRAVHPVIGARLDPSYEGQGARVSTEAPPDEAVVPGGPAHEAGIRPGDVVTAMDGVRVEGAEALIVRIRSHRPGDRVTFRVERGGDARRVRLVLASSDGG